MTEDGRGRSDLRADSEQPSAPAAPGTSAFQADTGTSAFQADTESSSAPAAAPESARRSDLPRRRPTLRSASAALISLPRALARLFIGPIFQREVLGAGRRRAPYILRFLYAAILLAVVSVAFAAAWSAMASGISSVAMAQSLQQVAPAITFTIGWFTLMAMALVGPALTGGAIADEKRARTLSALMTTPLTSLEIIVGKLASRTVQIMVLALLAAPLLLAMRLFGGVPAMAVVGTMAVSLSVALLGAALGIMYSIWHRRGTSAMGFAILTLGLVSFGPLLLWIAITRFNTVPPDLVLASSAVFSMLGLQNVDPTFARGVQVTVGSTVVNIPLWAVNTIYHLLVTALAVWISAAGLRRVMLAEASGGAGAAASGPELARRQRRAALITFALILLVSCIVGLATARLGAAPAVAAGLGAAIALLVLWGVGFLIWRAVGAARRRRGAAAPAGAGEGARHELRPSRDVGDSPVLWRELRQSSFGSRRKLAASMAAAYGIPLILWIRYGLGEEGVHFTIGIICMLGAMLQAAVMTTSAVGAERESGSWETLLTTPLSAWQILGGKFAGALRRQWLLPSVLVIDVTLAAVGGWGPWLLLLHVVIVFAGPIVLLSAGGVLMSLLFRKPTVAAVANLSWAIALWLGTWFVIGLVGWVTWGAGDLLEALVTLNFINSPVVMLVEAMDAGLSEWNRGDYSIAEWRGVSAGMFTLVAAIASGLQILAAVALLALAAARFNRLTGRAS